MENEEHIVRYTAAEIDALRERGEFKTNWAYVDALTDEEIEASIDFEEEGIFDPDTRRTYTVWNEQIVTLPLDDAVVEWFRAAVAGTGLGYKARIGEVLRDYVASQVATTPASPPAPTPEPTAIAPAAAAPVASPTTAGPRRRAG